MIKRDFYLERLIRSMHNGEVKVITGLRRCGKSVLLFELFYEYLIKQGIHADNIIKIELDQRRFYKYRNPIVLCDYVSSIVNKHKDRSFFLFIDEVQLTSKFVDKEHDGIEVTIYDMLNELRAHKNLDVYVTGSNSKGLSHDIATEFRGRATQIHIFPLSFAEYYTYVGGDQNAVLEQFMLYGGLPKIALIENDMDRREYLQSLYNELYIKDIVERNKVKREDILNDLLDFLSSQISSLSNPSNIANALSSTRKEKINSVLIANYIQHIIDSFLLYSVKRYDVKGKTYFSFPNKYYYADIGLRNIRLNYRQYDPGHIMENIIYNDLLRRGFTVDVGVVVDRTQKQNLQREIDFVVNQINKRIYIQSSYRMDSDEKLNIELKPFALTKDFYKKIVIRTDIPHNFYDDKGIYHCKLTDFLLEKIEL